MPVFVRTRLKFEATVTFLAFLASGIHAFAAESGPTTVSENTELTRWAITQGGLFLFTAIMGWSYKRDWERVFTQQKSQIELERDRINEERNRTDAVMQLIREATAAHVQSAAASDALKQATYELSSVVRATFQAPRLSTSRDNG